jgi:hypothetical protein
MEPLSTVVESVFYAWQAGIIGAVKRNPDARFQSVWQRYGMLIQDKGKSPGQPP